MLILLCLLYSCDKSSTYLQELDFSNIDSIKVAHLPEDQNSSLSELVSSYRYLRLETRHESLIGEITNLALAENRVFIHDRISRSLVIFDGNGRFVARISAKGNGPGEFSELQSFTINLEEEQLILGAVGKVLVYDFLGNFVDEYKTVLGASYQLGYIGDGKVAAYTNYIYLDESQGYNHVVILDLRSKKLDSKHLPFNEKLLIENVVSFYNNFSPAKSDDKYLSIPFKDVIWKLSRTTVKPSFYLDFGKDKLPLDFEERFLTDRKYNSSRIRELESEKNWNRLRGGGVFVSGSFISFIYSEGNRQYEVFYDRLSEKGIKLRLPLINDLDGSRAVGASTIWDDKFVSFVTAGEVVNGVKKGIINKSDIVDLSTNLKVDDNPILRIVEFKPIK